jgi:hypothetical protein
VRHIAAGGTVYRVDPGAALPPARSTPRLVMGQGPFGKPLTDRSFTWTVIAENIEDMQIAVILNDGTVWGSNPDTNNTDDPTRYEFRNIAAVRITLVGRSSSPVSGAGVSLVGGYEDYPNVKQTDGYLRRSLTSTIQLRNNNLGTSS